MDLCRGSDDIYVMRRRAFLATAATGVVVGSAGCIGGEVVYSKEGTVTVPPERGEIFELPSEGEEIKYIARDDQPFSVYVFTEESDVESYRTYIKGSSPDERPRGDRSLGGQAIKMRSDLYEISTEDRGRQSLEGPAYFAIDNSNYRPETPLGDDPEKLSVQLDLKFVASSMPI